MEYPPVTAERLAETLHTVLRCARGRIGEAIEQDAQDTLDRWDAQQGKGAFNTLLSDDTEYAALILSQLDREELSRLARAEAAWKRIHGASGVTAEAIMAEWQARLTATRTRGGDGEREMIEHNPSTNGRSEGDCTTEVRI